jgi:hypothetical protein
MPTINLDCIHMGKSRFRPCEDYALAGKRPLAHLILADGCSESVGTHLGAALLAHAARLAMNRLVAVAGRCDVGLPNYDRLGRAALLQAAGTARRLRLPATALDATLMVLLDAGPFLEVYVYGDGCIVWYSKQADVPRVMEVRFDTNAPYYLSYRLDRDRLRLYRDTLGGSKRLRCTHDRERELAFDAPTRFRFPARDTQTLVLASDGLGAFVGPDPADRLPLESAAALLTAFKNPCGAFLQRRVRRGVRQLEGRGYRPADDLSLAAMWRIDTEEARQ